MTPQPSTSLRVRFAIARGWKFWNDGVETLLLRPSENWPARPYWKACGFVEGDGRPAVPLKDDSGLPPVDANTVREAWKTLTPEEKRTFVIKLKQRLELSFPSNSINEVLEKALDTEPTTLAEIYCEVKGVK